MWLDYAARIYYSYAYVAVVFSVVVTVHYKFKFLHYTKDINLPQTLPPPVFQDFIGVSLIEEGSGTRLYLTVTVSLTVYSTNIQW